MALETLGFLDRVLGYGALDEISRDYFYAVLDYYCNPDHPLLSPTLSQPIIGLGSGDGKGIDKMAITHQPLFRHGNHGQKTRMAASQVEGDQSARRERFATAASQKEARNVVTEALVDKL
ncbi:hypothetical protein CC80DRAFT_556474 [Byssothecium circinans]|uniref:Uncharacterized protein n=1 Tax=Byssothecium circinans TaxID=147558 RepID=A0A6A5T7W9_9PLEO|nr:hypothetical protein CC80DRAFT_556575 [Byssothecium circinans]KAF1948288.1 hypothetical protein CC80DRAFT_556474 [Byssothecium circinans]